MFLKAAKWSLTGFVLMARILLLKNDVTLLCFSSMEPKYGVDVGIPRTKPYIRTTDPEILVAKEIVTQGSFTCSS